MICLYLPSLLRFTMLVFLRTIVIASTGWDEINLLRSRFKPVWLPQVSFGERWCFFDADLKPRENKPRMHVHIQQIFEHWSLEKTNRARLLMHAHIFTVSKLSSFELINLSMFKRIPCSNFEKSIIGHTVSFVYVCFPAYLWGKFMHFMIAIQHSTIT